ncbi:coiled-coil domain-containing protein [Marinisporobacter balticus]|uniref:Uncharacterized protein n=1 Tax=Marinisporobacter balticus TaxID=2018667 RepID=A0A4R2LKU7_9FIRM|nr:hypothetical protein [Marinisporobacter balticus]TCO80015.1 hypothetical protein EV214_101251 [Marinisporobacter balticus]
MSFANQRNTLIHDHLGNLYNFRWDEERILYTYFDKYLKKYEKDILVEDCTLEFDAGIDAQNNVYFVYQRKDGRLILKSLVNGFWQENLLGGENTLNILNLNLFIDYGRIHIIYCVPSNESDMTYRIYHHYYDEQGWKNFVVQDIERKNLLNPFQMIKKEKNFVVGFYDLMGEEEQIFIKEFNTETDQWENTIQLTDGSNNRVYLDILITKKENLHLTYSEYFQGNLLIKDEKYKVHENKAIKIAENIISNPSNCTNPTFIKDHDKLWNVWTEYDQIVSSLSTDDGITWSEPYLWKESKEEIFFRYKFDTNDENIDTDYRFNYSFGKDYPEFSFIGFGPLERAEKIPLQINKKKEEEACVMELEEVKRSEKQINDVRNDTIQISKLQKDIEKLEAKISDIKNLEERINNIEEYFRRRRGLFFSRK